MDSVHNSWKGEQSGFMMNGSSIDMDERDFAIDIFDFEELKKMRVVAELTGVNEEDIGLDLRQDILTISAKGGNRNYYKDVQLPRTCENIIGKICSNGILEVTLNLPSLRSR